VQADLVLVDCTHTGAYDIGACARTPHHTHNHLYCRSDLVTGAWTKVAALTPAQRIAIEKAKHDTCRQQMKAEFEGSKPLQAKYKALVNGYVERDKSLGEQLRQKTVELARRETEAACLEVGFVCMRSTPFLHSVSLLLFGCFDVIWLYRVRHKRSLVSCITHAQ
jgi:hypothetical protein